MSVFRFKKWQIAVFVAVLALGGLSLWYLNVDTPEAQVRRALRNLCATASKGDGESGVMAGLKVSRGAELFAATCRLEFKHDMFTGDYSNSELAANLARFRSLFTRVTVSIRDLNVTMESPTRAVAVFTGFLDGDLKAGGSVSEVRDLSCTLVRDGERWKVEQMNIRDVLVK